MSSSARRSGVSAICLWRKDLSSFARPGRWGHLPYAVRNTRSYSLSPTTLPRKTLIEALGR